MTEDEARDTVIAGVSRETSHALDAYVACLIAAAPSQNLIARSTIDLIWHRHILDSWQLAALAPCGGRWLDIGSGAGLPGLVIAALSDRAVTLIEPRAKRCAFLHDTAVAMGVADRVTILQSRAETAPPTDAAVITARAVASLSALFAMSQRFSSAKTMWILPKGRTAAEEVAVAQASWQARIRLVPSITDSEAAIVVATDVAPRKGKRA